MERLDNKHGYVYRTRVLTLRRLVQFILFCIYVLSFQGLIRSGFYQAMELYDQYGGPDPNVGNIFWLVSKVVVFWLLVPMIRSEGDSAPLRLDPRVLIW